MPGISERAERSVSLRRRLRWKLIAKRWASSRSCCRMNISALLLRIGMASLAWGRNTRSGFVAAPASRAPLLAGAGAGGPGTGGSAAAAPRPRAQSSRPRAGAAPPRALLGVLPRALLGVLPRALLGVLLGAPR